MSLMLQHATRALAIAPVMLHAVSSAALADSEPERLYFNTAYDEAADPFADLEAAKAEALASGRRILMEVGGDWCSWRHILDAYLENNPDVGAEFARSFLVLRVNWSQANENEAFLSAYPEIPGYPHFFVLEAAGDFVHSQGTLALEDGGESYDRDAMIAFARSWRLPGE